MSASKKMTRVEKEKVVQDKYKEFCRNLPPNPYGRHTQEHRLWIKTKLQEQEQLSLMGLVGKQFRYYTDEVDAKREANFYNDLWRATDTFSPFCFLQLNYNPLKMLADEISEWGNDETQLTFTSSTKEVAELKILKICEFVDSIKHNVERIKKTIISKDGVFVSIRVEVYTTVRYSYLTLDGSTIPMYEELIEYEFIEL